MRARKNEDEDVLIKRRVEQIRKAATRGLGAQSAETLERRQREGVLGQCADTISEGHRSRRITAAKRA